MEPKFISIRIAQAECELNRRGWHEFCRSTGLKVRRLPGNGWVVNRAELDAAIEKGAEVVDASSVPNEVMGR